MMAGRDTPGDPVPPMPLPTKTQVLQTEPKVAVSEALAGVAKLHHS